VNILNQKYHKTPITNDVAYFKIMWWFLA